MSMKTFNIGKVKLDMQSNGFPKGFKLKRKLTLRECRYIMRNLLGIDIADREDYEWTDEYADYNRELVENVNAWLEGEFDDSGIAEYAYDCSDEQLGLFNMIPIAEYLIRKGVVYGTCPIKSNPNKNERQRD